MRLHVRSSGMEFRPLGCRRSRTVQTLLDRLKPELHAHFGYGVRSSGRRRGRLPPNLEILRNRDLAATYLRMSLGSIWSGPNSGWHHRRKIIRSRFVWRVKAGIEANFSGWL